MWYGVCSLLVMAHIDIPNLGQTLTTPLLPGSRMNHEQVQQTCYGGGLCGIGGSSSVQQAVMQKMKHRVQLFPDGSGPRRFDVQKVIVHPGEVSQRTKPSLG